MSLPSATFSAIDLFSNELHQNESQKSKECILIDIGPTTSSTRTSTSSQSKRAKVNRKPVNNAKHHTRRHGQVSQRYGRHVLMGTKTMYKESKKEVEKKEMPTWHAPEFSLIAIAIMTIILIVAFYLMFGFVWLFTTGTGALTNHLIARDITIACCIAIVACFNSWFKWNDRKGITRERMKRFCVIFSMTLMVAVQMAILSTKMKFLLIFGISVMAFLFLLMFAIVFVFMLHLNLFPKKFVAHVAALLAILLIIAYCFVWAIVHIVR